MRSSLFIRLKDFLCNINFQLFSALNACGKKGFVLTTDGKL